MIYVIWYNNKREIARDERTWMGDDTVGCLIITTLFICIIVEYAKKTNEAAESFFLVLKQQSVILHNYILSGGEIKLGWKRNFLVHEEHFF